MTALSHAAALDDVGAIQPAGDDPFDLTDKAVEHLIQESGGKICSTASQMRVNPSMVLKTCRSIHTWRSLRDHVPDLAECLDELLVQPGGCRG